MLQSDYSPDRMVARAQIHDAIYLWCRAVDRCDWDAAREVFYPEAHDNHGLYRGGVDGMIAWLSKRHESISRSMHHVGNLLIEFADPETALVETYTYVVQRYLPQGAANRAAIAGGADIDEGEFDMLMTGRYVDEFKRREGLWKILRRVVIFDNSMILPVPASAPKLGSDWVVSTRGKDDPLWALREKLSLK